MPSTCPAVESNLKPLRAQRSNRHLRGSVRRRQLRPLTKPGNIETDDDDLFSWLGWFYRFHTDPPLYVPYALRTLDCVVELRQRPELRAPRIMRCVREVAKFNGVKAVEWFLITWVPGLPGITCQRCESQKEAMALLDSAPAPLLM